MHIALETAAVGHEGGQFVIHKGRYYDSDHWAVRDHPKMFAEVTVETTSAAPGEKRNAPRRTR